MVYESIEENMLVEIVGEDDRSEADESVNKDELVENAEEIAGVPLAEKVVELPFADEETAESVGVPTADESDEMDATY